MPLTERGHRLRRRGPLLAARRWVETLLETPPAAPTPAAQLARAPHVMVAVDLADRRPGLAEAMRAALRRALVAEPDLRVTLVAICPPQPFGEEAAPDLEQGQQTSALIELRHWAQPLSLPAEKLRLHAEASADPAGVLLDYAATHHADRIIVGARGHSALRRYLGSVSARVVAEASCTVTVVRPAQP